MNPRFRISLFIGLGLVGAVAALEASGRLSGRGTAGSATGLGDGGCAADGAGVPSETPANVKDAVPVPPKDGNPNQRASLYADAVPGHFVIRLADDVAEGVEIDAGGGLMTNIPDLDDALGQLKVRGARHVTRPSVKKLLAVNGLKSAMGVECDCSLDDLTTALEDFDEIVYVEPVIRNKVHGTPTDEYYPLQWNMQTMAIPEAWSTSTGAGVLIAVIDSGVSKSNMDGLTALETGYDFVDKDEDATDEGADVAGFSHGAFVAGIIAQKTDNHIGTVGMAYDARILPIRVAYYDADEKTFVANSDTIAEAIRWAVDNGAHIINLSMGSESPAEIVHEACDYAQANGVYVVASSGNNKSPDTLSYPAQYDSVIAVGATDLNHDVAYYSNRGSSLDIVAPGGDMTVDQDGDGYMDGIIAETEIAKDSWAYSWGSGTSFAAPQVSALIAMLLSKGVHDGNEIRDAITLTATDLGTPGYDTSYGAGEINPVEALKYKAPATVPPVELSPVLSARIGKSMRFAVTWTTNVEADTQAVDAAGTPRAADATMTFSHRVVVRVPRSVASLTLTISSKDGAGNTASQDITLVR